MCVIAAHHPRKNQLKLTQEDSHRAHSWRGYDYAGIRTGKCTKMQEETKRRWMLGMKSDQEGERGLVPRELGTR